ncbi:hypothetical protein J31TS4_16370 [Paenibacillus sp. J31TS4]|uniref:hypothetical protein n=1 Tax=Paenibacillus sp. J31TS4 TaxID=2807195 RepID=UPI001B0C0908|nr:hypothetical protein [Paenibacillus sp. J31TS4]GIP38357.1 hypothetical protein J31TS4_16370 [Paenibacillus sp. J31TS4]
MIARTRLAAVAVSAAAMLLVSGCEFGLLPQHAAPHKHSHSASTSAEPGDPSAYQAAWTVGEEGADHVRPITIQIADKAGKPVEKFDINHEKKLHLIVVSKDLTYFEHLHPDYQGGGRFEGQCTFPAGGEYKLFADFVPSRQAQTTLSEGVTLPGAPLANASKKLAADTSFTKTDGTARVTLSIDRLQAGAMTMLNFGFRDKDSGKPITDLQPYLGAVGHVVVLSEDTEQYLHSHPADEKAKGPDAMFHVTFPKPGLYKIWGQFQRKGEMIIVSYVVEVTP